MKAMLKAVGSLCFVLVLIGITQAQDWQAIRPLHSSRSAVEKLFGKAGQRSPASYILKDKSILIAYSDGLDCNDKGADGWNLPKDTVLTVSITFFPDSWFQPSELKFNLNEFEKSIDDEFPNVVYYRSNEKGIGVDTENGLVKNISYFPAKKHWHLMCPKPAPNNSFNASAK